MNEHNVRQLQPDDEEIIIDIGKLLVDLMRGLKKFWWYILILAVAGASLLCLPELRRYRPLYEAHASFTVQTQIGSLNNEAATYSFYYDKRTADQLGKTFPYILNSDLLKEELKKTLGTEVINGSIRATSIKDSNLFTLKVVSGDEADALKILNATIEVYPNIAQYVIGKIQFQMIEEPELSDGPINVPDFTKKAIYGAMSGSAIGLLLLFIYALSRKTIREPEDLKRVLNIECLATLPGQKKILRKQSLEEDLSILNENVDPAFLESMWSLQNRVENLMKKQNKQVLLLTSTCPSEGKTTISMNLALAIAQNGKKVLLMDGDLRKPDLKERLHVKGEPVAIEDVLAGRVKLEDALYSLMDGKLLFFGNDKAIKNPARLIGTRAMAQLVDEFRKKADIIIIDAPPCGMMADASQYWKYVDTVLYVVRQDWVNEKQVINAVQDLPESGSKLSGCILNHATVGQLGYGHGYGKYGYGKYGYGRYGYDYGKYSRNDYYSHHGEKGSKQRKSGAQEKEQ